MNNKTKDDIDHELMQWAESIQKAAETSIPKSKINYHIHPQESDSKNLRKFVHRAQKLRLFE